MINGLAIERLIPNASEWLAEQEAYILYHGVSLATDLQIDAYLCGVKDPAKIRVLEFATMPTPSSPELGYAANKAGLITDTAMGISFRHGIAVLPGLGNARKLIVHELVHTMQYERIGSIKGFLRQYVQECARVGYPNGALEQEAIRISRKICG